MAIGNLKLEVLLQAIDRATAPIRNITRGSKGLAGAVKEARDRLKQLERAQGDIDAFRKLNRDAAITSNQLKAAQERVRSLDQAMRQSANPTRQMARELEQARRQAAELGRQSQELNGRLQATRTRLNEAGINTRNLGQHQRELRARIEAANRQLAEQQRRLEAVNERMRRAAAARASFQRGMAARDRLAGAGASMLAGGAVAGSALAVPVIEFAKAEDSAAQLRVAMMGAGAVVRPEFEQINALAERLGNRLPGTTAELQDMMTTLIRQGMSAKAILGGIGEASAYLGVQLKMPYSEAAEFSAKLQDATKTAEGDMMSLMDTIQRAYYLGVDPTNMLQGFGKISPALDILKKKGLEGAKALAPLLVMTDQAGMAGEAAGNAYRKIFQAAMNADGKVSKANKALAAQKIALDFTNGKGEFGGLDKLFAQLDKLKKLNTQDRISVIKTIFGDDAETLQTVSLLIDKGKAGYEETLAKMKDQAALQERVNLQLGTLKNLWDAATGTATNALVAFGEAVAPEVKSVVEWIGQASEGVRAWAKENPQLAGTLMKIAAGIAITLSVLGALTMALAVFLGPLVIVRYGLAMFGIQMSRFGFVATMLRGGLSGIGTALMWIGRLAMANPLIAVISILAMGALYIWQNWGTLGPKFQALWSGIRSYVLSAWNGITAYLSGLAGQFMTIGAQIIDGMKAGIMSRIAGVREAISSAAGGAIDAAKRVLGIRSPSRVFAEIGAHTVAGFSAGIAANQDSTVQRIVHLSRRITAAGAANMEPIRWDTRPPIQSAALAGSGAGGGAAGLGSITINVYPSAGMDEAALAGLVRQQFQELERQAAARGRSRLSDRD